MGATWQATGRYSIASAPGTLGLIHDLLNTVPAGRPRTADLLADTGTAQKWVDSALAAWADTAHQPVPRIRLDEEDLVRLRDLRRALRDSVTPPEDGEPVPHDGDPTPQEPVGTPVVESAHASLGLDAAGAVHLAPRGGGAGFLIATLLLTLWQAQNSGDRQRLKLCRNPRCAVAFYDRSRNNSGVWHDVRTCGNAANLRAHRARQRDTAASQP
ncbi:CGNR zinc finger domain-containing protein [Streptomyces sp. NPDC048295]|uniref:CGNR zinc finger domain-containing protein n=1 Tax=Streptomyces sp. NPDC048295 TaxID=3154617 RepID=UPI00343A51AE